MRIATEHQRLKTRQQEWLGLAVLVAIATLAFELWPQADLRVSAWFYEQGVFQGSQWLWARLLYHGMPLVGGMLAAAALLIIVAALVARLMHKKWVPVSRLRQSIFGLLVVVLGVGLLVHDGLKDNWGRARPMDVQAFGGSKIYQPPLRPSDQCDRNCSFVSGHAAGGFALMAIGMLGSRRSRWRWWIAGMSAGCLVGLARIVEGRHFMGDVIFAGLLIWAVCLLLRQVWLWLRLRKMKRMRTPPPA
jgi:membrane-associated PAP2 superfamily phosphatase